MTWTKIEIADDLRKESSDVKNRLILLDLREVEDFEVLAPQVADENSNSCVQQQEEKQALALATARAGLCAIPIGGIVYTLQVNDDDASAALYRDNRVYIGKIQILKSPILVCSCDDSGGVLRIHAKIDQKIVFETKPKYIWN